MEIVVRAALMFGFLWLITRVVGLTTVVTVTLGFFCWSWVR